MLDLVLPLEPPVEFGWVVLSGPFVELVLATEKTDGAEGVASGSLPAAWARTLSNVLSYTVC